MTHYRSNLRDIEFNVFELFEVGRALGTAPFEAIDESTAHDILDEVERLASGPLAASFVDADRNPPTFDPATGSVTMPESFKRSYQALVDGEWFRLDLPTELGGFGVSPLVRWAASELLLGSNPAAFIFNAGPGFGAILHQLGTPDQQGLAQQMIEHCWGATMVLTEPDAGSDVGAGRSKALPQPDGTWHLEGVKRFITSAEWDVPDNIVHLVLARPVGVDGAGGPGTKGLSLFVVPKFLVNADGTLGARNGVYVTNLEKKMGLKVSTTCELTFGEHEPAIGTLVGGVHDGIAQMFQVIEYARMMVGAKAIATLSTGYLNALEYAKQRVQGADLARMSDKTAPRVPITRHPDVRRMLMLQKAYAEGLRSLVLLAASYQERIEIARHRGNEDAVREASAVNDLLLPLVKGFGSERSCELLASSLQVLGGSGYLQDYPIEQYIRDSKIDTLYEGTTSIQGIDLFFRKIQRDSGRALDTLFAEVEVFAVAGSEDAQKVDRVALGQACGDVRAIVATLRADAEAARQEPNEIYRVGLNTNRLLMSLGDLIVGWLLQRSAAIAVRRLADDATSASDHSFYAGKIAAASFFAQTVLPELSARRAIVSATTLDLMNLDESAF